MFSPILSEDSISRVKEILRQRWIGQGTEVEALERAIDSWIGKGKAVAVSTNAAALRIALRLSQVEPGAEVISSPMACTATNQPILEQGASITFADIQSDTGNLDPQDVARRVSGRTKAIVCYDFGGYPCDLNELRDVARQHSILLIEDASEGLGTIYDGRPVGSHADYTVFSLQPTSIITGGEGGVLVSDEQSAERARRLRWYGIDRVNRKEDDAGYYDFDIREIGYGYHMTNINAALAVTEMRFLDRYLEDRNLIAARYTHALSNVPGITLFTRDRLRSCSHHGFYLHVERRNDFHRALKSRGIETSIVHQRNDHYTIFGGVRRDLPGLDRFSSSYIALPNHSFLTAEDVDRVIDGIAQGW